MGLCSDLALRRKGVEPEPSLKFANGLLVARGGPIPRHYASFRFRPDDERLQFDPAVLSRFAHNAFNFAPDQGGFEDLADSCERQGWRDDDGLRDRGPLADVTPAMRHEFGFCYRGAVVQLHIGDRQLARMGVAGGSPFSTRTTSRGA